MIDFQLQIYLGDADTAESAESQAEANGFGDQAEVHYGLGSLEHLETLLINSQDLHSIRDACRGMDEDSCFLFVFDTDQESIPLLTIPGLKVLGTFPGEWRDDPPDDIPNDPCEVVEWSDEALRNRWISIGLAEPYIEKSALREIKSLSGRSLGETFAALKSGRPVLNVDVVSEFPEMIERVRFFERVKKLIDILDSLEKPLIFGISHPGTSERTEVNREVFGALFGYQI